jgi:hypothetical protein
MRVPGTTCGLKLGIKWIDVQTSSRTRNWSPSERLNPVSTAAPWQLLVSADPKAVATTPPVVLQQFNTSKAKYVSDIVGLQLGVHPPGQSALANSVELIFKVDMKLAASLKLVQYRCHQTTHSAEVWQRELIDGNITPWALVGTTGVGEDGPVPEVQYIRPPIIAYYDAPGFGNDPSSEQMGFAPGKSTSKRAAMLFLRQNFVGWVDGRAKGSAAQWRSVSDKINWHSNQYVIRAIGKIDVLWNALEKGGEIELGHTSGKPNL